MLYARHERLERRHAVLAHLLCGAALCIAMPCCTPGLEKCEAMIPARDHLLVEYEAGGTSGLPPKVEVSDTPGYKAHGAEFKTAAIQMPTSCLTEGAATATGTSTQSKMIMRTDCAVWLAEIERALSIAGFRVISWDALAERQRQGGSTYEAAEQLGAEIVFMLNSLETNQIKAGGAQGTRFRYFHSDKAGSRGAPFALSETDRDWFHGFVADRIDAGEHGGRVVALASTLDATVILSHTGESIWFYRQIATKPVASAASMRFLFVHAGDQWRPVAPDLPPQAPQTHDAATEDGTSAQVGATPENPYAAEEHALVRMVARSCIEHFRAAVPQGAAR